MKKRLRLVSIGFVFLAFMIGILTVPVRADEPPDYTVEYYDDFNDAPGTWYENDNDAVEGGSWGFYLLTVEFYFFNVPQDGDVYKIRIDYDDSEPSVPENLYVNYRWTYGGGPWGYVTTCCANRFDTKFTINDPTTATLTVRFMDAGGWFDFTRDKWEFGREPELWIYWN